MEITQESQRNIKETSWASQKGGIGTPSKKYRVTMETTYGNIMETPQEPQRDIKKNIMDISEGCHKNPIKNSIELA